MLRNLLKAGGSLLAKLGSRLVPLSVWMWLGKRIPVSFSQFGEDIWVAKTLGSQLGQGSTCIEVGAFNGVRYSNTAMLESRYGSRCLLIEPSPRLAAICRILRPNSEVVCAAAGARSEVGLFAGHRPISGLVKHFSQDYRRNWGVDRLDTYEVPVMTLNQVIQDRGIERVDFLSIDVQGGELEVLEGLDPEASVACICIELEGSNPDRDEECRTLLRRRGYQFSGRLIISEFWIRPQLAGASSNAKLDGRWPSRWLSPFAEPWARREVRDSLREF